MGAGVPGVILSGPTGNILSLEEKALLPQVGLNSGVRAVLCRQWDPPGAWHLGGAEGCHMPSGLLSLQESTLGASREQPGRAVTIPADPDGGTNTP